MAASNTMGKDVCYRSLGGVNPMWFRALWERVFNGIYRVIRGNSVKSYKCFILAAAILSSPVLAEERKEISLKFTDVETVKVLKIIADFSGRGLVLPDSNLGVTTVYLSKVPWKEALHAVTTSENLDLEITNNVIVISRKRCGKTTMFTKGKT